METKDWVLGSGVLVTFLLGLANLIYNLHFGKRTAFVNTVTSERVKWISKVRENIAILLSLCGTRLYNPPADLSELDRQIDKLRFELRLQLNPKDPEDMRIEGLLEFLPSQSGWVSGDAFHKTESDLVSATQVMLKREWDTVKKEAVNGDLKAKRRWWLF